MARVLIVEDDSYVRSAMVADLTRRSHAVRTAGTALDGIREVSKHPPELIVLDLGLPDLDGGQALKMMRTVTTAPVIVATARDEEAEIIRLLNDGADDYVVKPFSGEHLAARIAALLRRASPGSAPASVIAVAGLSIDQARREALLDGRRLELSRREFDLLAYLAVRPGTVVSRRELLTEVWHQAYGDDQTIDVHVSWLRRKLGETAARPRYLHTVRGVGVDARRAPMMRTAMRAPGRNGGELGQELGAELGRNSVRTTLALVAAAVTSMVAIAFLIPLAVIVRDVARDRAFTSAQLTGAAIEPVLSITTDRAALERAIVSTPAGAAGQLAVYLTAAPASASAAAPAPASTASLAGTFVGGPQRASAADLRMATTAARSFIAPVPGGYAVLQPVALGGGRLAVTEVYVPAAEVSRGVAASWAVMTAVALALIAVSVVVADRLASRVTRPARELAQAAALLGDGDLSARSTARGPAELAAAGRAFNAMAERLSGLITAERVMSADLPHRLRTPLTALRMNAAALGPGRAADDTRTAIDRLEQQVDLIIRAARRPGPDEPAGCDAAKVLADRFEFWSALAEDQGRPCRLAGADLPVPVPVPRSDLAAAADALIGNIFKHTRGGHGVRRHAAPRRGHGPRPRGRRRAKGSRTPAPPCGGGAAARAPPASGSTSPAASPSPPAAG